MRRYSYDRRVALIEDGESRGRMDVYRPGATRHHAYDIEKVACGLLGEVGDFKVYTVDGDYVRTVVDIDFTMAGNPGRYSYVPEGSVWVEDALPLADAIPTVLHEVVECLLMQRDGIDYNHAHDLASEQELKLRGYMEGHAFAFKELEPLLSLAYRAALREHKRLTGEV